jgi:hypothetical protein
VAEVNQAISEAWAWLEAQGLLIPAPDTNGVGGWLLLSRRARKIETEAEFADYTIARLLPKELPHPRMADRVWGAFTRGEYDDAVFRESYAKHRSGHVYGVALTNVPPTQDSFGIRVRRYGVAY